MRKTLPVLLFLFLALTLSACNRNTDVLENETDSGKAGQKAAADQKSDGDYPMSSLDSVADKLEVYYFHRTARCYSCNTAGQYVRELVADKYQQEIESGRLDFREINVDTAENKEIAKKFQATGSALYINRIKDGQDNIEPDVNIWRLLGDETRFKGYLESKINSYLGI